jgi:hypothetical protein
MVAALVLAAWSSVVPVGDLEALVTGIETRDLHAATRACERDFDRYFQDIRWNLRCANAYALAGNDERAEFHRYVHGGLVRSVLVSGDGESRDVWFNIDPIFRWLRRDREAP